MDHGTIDKLMRIAIDIGKRSVSEAGKVSPKVGAAIIKDGHILGSAFRGEKEEGDHAEYTLFEKTLKGQDVSGATLFTTLEPCTHRNSHKSCSDWIIEKGIKQVYIGILDPNPKIYNHGCVKLKNAGIEVDYFPLSLRKEIESDNSLFINQFSANPELKGKATFNYSSNNGKYTIGNNEMIFETMWHKASDISIYASNYSETIKTIAIAEGNVEINEIKDGSIYDKTSNVTTVYKNGIVILQNIEGFFAAIKVIDIQDKSRPDNNRDELTFEYKILSDKTPYFHRNALN